MRDTHSWFELCDENDDCSVWNVNKCGNGLNHTWFYPKNTTCQTGNNINSMWVWMTSGKEKCMFKKFNVKEKYSMHKKAKRM